MTPLVTTVLMGFIKDRRGQSWQLTLVWGSCSALLWPMVLCHHRGLAEHTLLEFAGVTALLWGKMWETSRVEKFQSLGRCWEIHRHRKQWASTHTLGPCHCVCSDVFNMAFDFPEALELTPSANLTWQAVTGPDGEPAYSKQNRVSRERASLWTFTEENVLEGPGKEAKRWIQPLLELLPRCVTLGNSLKTSLGLAHSLSSSEIGLGLRWSKLSTPALGSRHPKSVHNYKHPFNCGVGRGKELLADVSLLPTCLTYTMRS